MVQVFHGASIGHITSLLGGASTSYPGLCVTESAELAQRYADAQASREVSRDLRYVKNAAVVTLETNEAIRWLRRPIEDDTLDTCEALIQSWRVAHVVVRMTANDIRSLVVKVNGRYVNAVAYFSDQLGDRFEVIEVI